MEFMRYCNANFVSAEGPVVQICHSNGMHLIGKIMRGVTVGVRVIPGTTPSIPTDRWWHSLFDRTLYNENNPWPVCWRKGGVMALWFGRDGWCAETREFCDKAGFDGWHMVYDQYAHDDRPFAYAPGDYDPNETELDSEYERLLSQVMNEHKAWVRVNGEWVRIYKEHDNFYETWPHCHNTPPPKEGQGDTWCGYNFYNPAPFVIFGKTKPPDPVYNGQYYYRISVHCTRLVIIQNAMLKPDWTMDFSKAKGRVIAHGGKGGFQGSNGEDTKLRGPNRTNGVRPLFYKRGAGRERGIVLPGYDDGGNKVFYFPPIDNAADPMCDPDDAADYHSPVYAPVTKEDGIAMPSGRYIQTSPIGHPHHEGYTAVDWPQKWPAYTL